MSHGSDSGAAQSEEKLSLIDLIEELTQLADKESDPEVQIVELKQGEVLFEQGEEGDSMYLLIAGVLGVRITQPDGSQTVIDKLAPGATVGEMALLSGQTRSATVYAINDVGLIRLTKSKFEGLSSDERTALIDVKETLEPRWQRLQLASVLRDLFGDMDAAALHALQSQLIWQHYSNGDVLFSQGDLADGMYILLNGRLRAVVQTPDGAQEIVSEITPGETVGEFALLAEEVRTATVYAVRETDVVILTPPVFEGLVKDHPQLIGRITRIIVERRQRTLLASKPRPSASLTLTLIPAGPEVDCERFAQGVVRRIAPHASALALNSHEFENRYGQPGSSQIDRGDPGYAAVTTWLSDLESEVKVLVFSADYEATSWTRTCIGHADRAILVANPQGDPTPGPAEKILEELEIPIRTDLVLWHSQDTRRPLNTKIWLDGRNIQAHYHLREGDDEHMGRLARILAGHGIALVLSGGGARGFAHLGVHRALEELGILPDFIGASSIGAVMGGAFACGWSNAEVMEKSAQFAQRRTLFDYTLPFTSLTASKKVSDLLQSQFGDLQIEDLWTPFYCMATNLSTAESVVFRQGSLWRAVRASLAIPGVFTPVMEAGDVLVDGSVMNNFPAKRMAALSQSDRILGVNVMAYRYKKRSYDFDTSISGWRILFNRINPFSKPLRTPSLVGTVMRSTEISSIHRTKGEEEFVDLMLYPDVSRFTTVDYDSYDEIAQVGYETAFNILKDWKMSWSESST